MISTGAGMVLAPCLHGTEEEMSAKVNTMFVTEEELDLIWRCINTEVIDTMKKNVESQAVDWDHITTLKKLRDRIEYELNHFNDDF